MWVQFSLLLEKECHLQNTHKTIKKLENDFVFLEFTLSVHDSNFNQTVQKQTRVMDSQWILNAKPL